jgi:hypothetical protein
MQTLDPNRPPPRATSRRIQRRVTSFFEFRLPSPPSSDLKRSPNSSTLLAMRLPVIVSMCALLFVGYGRSRRASPAPAPLPSVSIQDVPAPASAEVTIQRGSNLREIACRAYGHERFSGFVGTQNGITDPGRVSAGSVLQTPSLAVCFRDATMQFIK